MKACCYVCKKKEEGTQEQLMDSGWQGAEGEINGNKYKFELCPAHSGAETIIKTLLEVKEGKKAFVVVKNE